jgi:hypothetical protein
VESVVLISKNEFQCKFINTIWEALSKKKEYDKFFVGFIKQTQPSIKTHILTSTYEEWSICCCLDKYHYTITINNPYQYNSDYILHLFLECYDLALTHFEKVINERRRTGKGVCERDNSPSHPQSRNPHVSNA